jgi:hypothetical protein
MEQLTPKKAKSKTMEVATAGKFYPQISRMTQMREKKSVQSA